MLDTSCWIATKSLLPMPSCVLMVVVHARSGLACFHFILSSAMVRAPMDILPQIWWTLILGSGDAIQRQTSVRHFFTCLLLLFLPLVLWCCWLGGRKGVWPVKLSGGLLVLLSVWSEVQTYMWSSCCHCHTVTVSRFSEIQICFIFLVLAHLGSPKQRAVKPMYVYSLLLLLTIVLRSQEKCAMHRKITSWNGHYFSFFTKRSCSKIALKHWIIIIIIIFIVIMVVNQLSINR